MPAHAQLVNARQIGEEFGLSTKTVNRLHTQRSATGFPTAAERRGRTQYWHRDRVAAWFAEREIGGRRLQQLGTAVADGDPDELLNASQVARLLGYKNPNQITTYLREHPGYFPEPDEVDLLGTQENPRRRLRWRRRTIAAWLTERPGKGKRTGSARSANPLPAVARDGDPDELLNATQTAALLGYKSLNSFSSSLSQGNLPLLQEADEFQHDPSGRPRRRWKRRRVLEQDAQRRHT